MLGLRQDAIWWLVLAVGLGILGISRLVHALPHLLQGSLDVGVAAALIIGLTATLLAVSALAQVVALIVLFRRNRSHRQS